MEQLSDQLAQRPAAGISPRGTLASPPSRLYLFSDGVYEVRKSDGSMLPFEEFLDVMVRPVAAGESELDRLLAFARAARRERWKTIFPQANLNSVRARGAWPAAGRKRLSRGGRQRRED